MDWKGLLKGGRKQRLTGFLISSSISYKWINKNLSDHSFFVKQGQSFRYMASSVVRAPQDDSEAKAGDHSRSLHMHENKKVQGNPAGCRGRHETWQLRVH